ncbi:hypothetical protein HOU04_gp078 [Synechococcus phage S-T4]|jgi:hypothetical protein|uniref:Uncharacterized protein n=1 Tax=Synechococcus phage S-T4 TaxID=2268578 RepID=A0A385EHH4_9CAUD|nr:hypothetical protein HOU04_gp078 [Synechococcus phage S-T4]AXQ70477.1 hypothetical protein [Synechococcus phage S-T4]
MTKGFDIDNIDIEIPKQDLIRLVKKYKKLKKYQKSNLHAIEKLSGKNTVIDRLIGESENFDMG